MNSIYDIISHNIKVTDDRTERANRPRAEKLYREEIIPRLENAINSKCIEIRWVPYDVTNKIQSNGIDGYFKFQNGTVVCFQEKTHLLNTIDSTREWDPLHTGYSHIIEIVNHGGGIGWTGKINNVSLLFIFYKDVTVVIGKKNLSKLVELKNYCNDIYDLWDGKFNSQNIYYDGIGYRLNAVKEKKVTSKTMITNISERTIKELGYIIKTYKK